MWPFVSKEETPVESLDEARAAAKAAIRTATPSADGYRDSHGRPEESNYHVAAAYSTIYTKVSRERKDVIREVERLREFYLTDVIINQFTEDALTPDVADNEIVRVFSDNKEINKEIKLLDQRIKFDQLVLDVTPDMLAYGEYILRTKIGQEEFDKKEADKKVEGLEEVIQLPDPDDLERKQNRAEYDKSLKKEGLLEILDDVDQSNIVAISKCGETIGYLTMEDGKIRMREEAEFVRFAMMSKKIRIDLYNELDTSFLKKTFSSLNIPRFVRVGRSVLYGVRGKIKELELLEKMVPATKLSKLSNGTLIGVQVPAGYDIKQATEAVRKIEGLINKKVGLDEKSKEITIENIMSAAGRLKCVPIFGDKGTLTKLDHKQDEPDDLLSSLEETRKSILSSVGIPSELLFGGDTPNKGELLRRYARYLRRLKAIQRAISDGIRQIVYIHLANRNISFLEKDVKVEFRNKLIEIDNLDKLEFLDTTVSMVTNLKNFVWELHSDDSPIKENINLQVILQFLDTQFRMVGLEGLIDTSKKVKDTETEPAAEDDEWGADDAGDSSSDSEIVGPPADDTGLDDDEDEFA